MGRLRFRNSKPARMPATAAVAPYGGINLDTLQRYLNLHYSDSLDLFGAQTSTNAANYYAAGMKGRFQESERLDDHRLQATYVEVPSVDGDTIASREVPALTALNGTLRSDYVADCQKGVDRWNRVLEDADAARQEWNLLPKPDPSRVI